MKEQVAEMKESQQNLLEDLAALRRRNKRLVAEAADNGSGGNHMPQLQAELEATKQHETALMQDLTASNQKNQSLEAALMDQSVSYSELQQLRAALEESKQNETKLFQKLAASEEAQRQGQPAPTRLEAALGPAGAKEPSGLPLDMLLSNEAMRVLMQSAAWNKEVVKQGFANARAHQGNMGNPQLAPVGMVDPTQAALLQAADAYRSRIEGESVRQLPSELLAAGNSLCDELNVLFQLPARTLCLDGSIDQAAA